MEEVLCILLQGRWKLGIVISNQIAVMISESSTISMRKHPLQKVSILLKVVIKSSLLIVISK